MLIYIIFLSSNEQRKRKIKDVCKKNNDLPQNIVKQIVEYELSKDKKFNLNRSIKEMRVLNERISVYEKAIKDAIKGREIINNTYVYEFPVIIDLGNGYGQRMTVMKAMNKLDSYRRMKREIIADARYEYMIKKYVTPFQRGVSDEIK